MIFKKVITLLLLIILVGCTSNENIKEEINDEKYKFNYNNIDLTPGTKFDNTSIDEEYEFFELDSCAFEGNDKVYKYENFELTSSSINDVETIYSIYFLNDSIKTIEGVKITDDLSLMIDKYGNSYELINNEYKYTKSNVILSFIVENDIIVSIEYIYNNI